MPNVGSISQFQDVFQEKNNENFESVIFWSSNTFGFIANIDQILIGFDHLD
jgi:hypothetical protein